MEKVGYCVILMLACLCLTLSGIPGSLFAVANEAEDSREEIPTLPDNVVAQLGDPANGTDNRGNTVGAYYHYTGDRIYCSEIAPVDFSRAPAVGFDIYVSDYDKFLAADNDPTDGKDSKLNFVVSSTAPGLWGQYQKPYMYYSAGIDLQPYITHSGWNHVVVYKRDFKTLNQGVDWSGLTAYMVYYRNSSSIHPYKNANSDLYVKVANIVNIGFIADIPADGDKPKTPDTEAITISTADGIADEFGTWNTPNGTINTTYKAEGFSSFTITFDSQSDPSEIRFQYLFDDTADLSDIGFLKFDFFVDLPQLLKSEGNNAEILIANTRKARSDYYKWEMDFSGLQQGWNTLAFDINDAKAVGKPDLNLAKSIIFRFCDLNIDATYLPKIMIGMDYLRYISNSGKTRLTVNSESENESPETDDSPILARTWIYDFIAVLDLNAEGGNAVFQYDFSENIDIRHNTLIEFDVYTSHTSNVPAGFTFFVTDDHDNTYEFEISDRITESGWNHIQLDIEDGLCGNCIMKNWGVTVSSSFRGYLADIYAVNYIKGDLDGDGKLSAGDLVTMTAALLSQTKFNAYRDLNRDGKVDILDLITLKKSMTQ